MCHEIVKEPSKTLMAVTAAAGVGNARPPAEAATTELLPYHDILVTSSCPRRCIMHVKFRQKNQERSDGTRTQGTNGDGHGSFRLHRLGCHPIAGLGGNGSRTRRSVSCPVGALRRDAPSVRSAADLPSRCIRSERYPRGGPGCHWAVRSPGCLHSLRWLLHGCSCGRTSCA